MSTKGLGSSPELDDPDSSKSQFTTRDLRLLCQSSVSSPLRTIALIDFDCFYAQCESVRLGLPDDQPLGVQQFKHVIATNYPARAAGLKKVITAVEARQKCPNIVLQHVPTWREGDTNWNYRDDVLEHMSTDKSSLDYYRLQSRRALDVVKKTLPQTPPQVVEKASIDEIFIDLSAQVHSVLIERYPELLLNYDKVSDTRLTKPWTQLLDWRDDRLASTESVEDESDPPDWDDVALNIGSEIVKDLRHQIYTHLRYTCSAGVSHNKVLAKLAAGHNKPNKQTVVRHRSVSTFLGPYKATKIRGLGGKLGQEVAKAFDTDSIADLLNVSVADMQRKLGTNAGSWVFRVIRGIEHEKVTPRTQIQSMLSQKTFTPSINGMAQAEKWLRIFAADIIGRMEDQPGRRPKTVAVHHHINGRFGPTRSKQTSIPPGAPLDAAFLFRFARDLLVEISQEGPSWPCLSMSVSVSDFVEAEIVKTPLSLWLRAKDPVSSSHEAGDASQHHLRNESEPHRAKKRTIFDYQGFLPEGHTATDANKADDGETPTKRTRHLSVEIAKVEEVPDISKVVADTGHYSCPICGGLIPADTVLEHLDWHAAMQIQEEHQ